MQMPKVEVETRTGDSNPVVAWPQVRKRKAAVVISPNIPNELPRPLYLQLHPRVRNRGAPLVFDHTADICRLKTAHVYELIPAAIHAVRRLRSLPGKS